MTTTANGPTISERPHIVKYAVSRSVGFFNEECYMVEIYESRTVTSVRPCNRTH